jgi:hypothetical protein
VTPGAERRAWEIVVSPEARSWYMQLSQKDVNRVAKALDRLEVMGPATGRGYVDSIKGSRFHNMKELRSVGRNIRVLFAFDPNRRALLLVGGDKTNDWKGWYARNVPRADKIYEKHLRSLGKEERWTTRQRVAGERSAGSGR